MRLYRTVTLVIVVSALHQFGAIESIAGGETLVLRLPETRFARENVPVSFKLPDRLNDVQTLALERNEDGVQVAVQRDPTHPGRVIWMLEAPLAAGQSRRYRLRTGSAKSTAPNVNNVSNVNSVVCQDDGKRLSFFIGDQRVLAYNYATAASPDREKPYYARSGFIHPVFSPAGEVLTDDFPPDHLHQHAVMFAWTNAEFQGHPVNFWDQAKQQGRIEHVRTESTVQGPVFGGFTAVLRHVDISVPEHETVVLEERWQVRIYRRTDGFLFDLESTQTCVAGEPLTINQYHYGGMAIRGRRNWFEPGQGDFLTSEGKTRNDGNHSRPNWCDVHGLVDGGQAGVTLFCHSGNFRAPQPVRLHPSKPYFCWAPMVLGRFDIQPGRTYISRYRFFSHNGTIDADEAERLRQDYADPAVAILAED